MERFAKRSREWKASRKRAKIAVKRGKTAVTGKKNVLKRNQIYTFTFGLAIVCSQLKDEQLFNNRMTIVADGQAMFTITDER